MTDEIAGKKKGIIDKPIILTVYSKHAPDLTIIDLPGFWDSKLKFIVYNFKYYY